MSRTGIGTKYKHWLNEHKVTGVFKWSSSVKCCFTHRSRDASIVVVADLITSLLGGIAIFAVLGHMSLELNVPIEEVAKAGRFSPP